MAYTVYIVLPSTTCKLIFILVKKVKKPELPAAVPKKVKENLEPEPRSLRQSTLDLSQEREKIRSYKSKFTKKSRSKQPKQGRKMTQEQLLEEAKQTEIENLASLEAYTRLEAEKKTFKAKKHFINGPIIRYHSVTMPVMATDDNKSSETTDRYSRNFMIFTDTKSFPKSFFPTELPQKPKRLYCKITGLPAKYVDPITGYPYATMQAFRVIRDRYVKEREEKCEERLLQLSNWLEEKKRLKKQTH
jgi:vacuolar protein sorting-associated protein 72